MDEIQRLRQGASGLLLVQFALQVALERVFTEKLTLERLANSISQHV
ncbi:hypothetical protein HX870_06175 [Pseudomonas gingeri]|nr:hypothetical protein [Pseudomonas gingeri]NWA24563.1 hypothetical protein [Pseudomonas gingeri]NWD67182.1 hypothetical protein [Pseudomonas gingeri]NWD77310.1 hypothetical protein [Pseudomonas gingeri]